MSEVPLTSLLTASGISKSFGGSPALQDVSFDIRPGEVHALVGENGAGKSTLVNILSGGIQPDSGEIRVNGVVLDAALDPERARAARVATIHQEFSLVPWLSVAENVFLGREPRTRLGLLDAARMRREAQEVLRRIGVDLDVTAVVAALSVAQQQCVEIAKALSQEPAVLIMDEPSAVLAGEALDRLFEIVDAVKARNVGVLYISHRLNEIGRLADRVTVLRDGRVVGTRSAADLTEDQIIRMMVGRGLEFGNSDRPMREDVAPLLTINGLQLRDGKPEIELDLYLGEILGIAGLVGSGRSRLLRVLAGLERANPGSDMRLSSTPVSFKSVRDAIAAGVVLVPEDRRGEGLLLELPVGVNVGLPSLRGLSRFGMIRARRLRQLAEKAVQHFDVRPKNVSTPARLLSGGNQQKVALAKWLNEMQQPRVLLLDEPTRGVDVGAKSEIYSIIREAAGEGMGVIVASSELPEILSVSDRIAVMREGSVQGVLDRTEASEEAIMRLAVPSSAALDDPSSDISLLDHRLVYDQDERNGRS